MILSVQYFVGTTPLRKKKLDKKTKPGFAYLLSSFTAFRRTKYLITSRCSSYLLNRDLRHLSSLLTHLLILLSCSFLFNIPLLSQNLLPDGGFEFMRDDSCRSPIENFKKMRYWHRLQPTPDLFIGGCPYNEENFTFWDDTTTPYEGNNFAGIFSH